MSNVRKIEYTAGESHSRVLVGESIESLAKYAPLERSFLVSDHTVHSLYRDRFPDRPCHIMPEGEHNKTLSTVSHLFDWLIDNGADRSHYIVAVGGGIVCDVAGFAASTYMRGLSFGFVSTTLLSQVDASVGGKNGVNYSGYKNMIGTFNQPDFVLCDMEMLSTLPDSEYINGLAEVLKHALIADSGMFDVIRANAGKIRNRDRDILHYLICRSIEIKSSVVSRDERESGLRRILNFGHTLAHALEKSAAVSHGMAVGLGMIFAARVSARRGLISDDTAASIAALCVELGIQAQIQVENAAIKEALHKDKKKSDSDIHFILLDKIGSAPHIFPNRTPHF
ncbi:MAG: 3-dehydroquinate synthase, partial [Spirochaetota bacterium]